MSKDEEGSSSKQQPSMFGRRQSRDACMLPDEDSSIRIVKAAVNEQRRRESKLTGQRIARMERNLKKEWERFVTDRIQSSLVHQFDKLKTDGERFIFCRNILRKDHVAQDLIKSVQKLLYTRKQQNGKSLEQAQEFENAGDCHSKKKNFKMAVMCYSKSAQFAPKHRLEFCHKEHANNIYSSLVAPLGDAFNVATIYSKRADVLFCLGEYKACLSDIQEVASLLHPREIPGELLNLEKSCNMQLRLSNNQPQRSRTEQMSPELAGGTHTNIANGSQLLEINYSSNQGRFLQASNDIRAGDTLISELPYASVVMPETAETHCEFCYKSIVAAHPCPDCSSVLYCSPFCREKARTQYHGTECQLHPLLGMVDSFAHLSLRILLVTGAEKILDVLKKWCSASPSRNSSDSTDRCPQIPGCTPDGTYLGDYSSVYSLVTNTKRQPTEALLSYALTAAFLAEFLEDVVPRVPEVQKSNDERGCSSCEANQQSGNNSVSSSAVDKRVFLLPGSEACSVLALADPNDPDVLSGDMIGCLLFHHLQQMSCNVHAITTIVTSSTSVEAPSRSRKLGTKQNVFTREQKRIASAIYPTASLLNHACDPDVLVSFVDNRLVVRATHNISRGTGINHCYGPHVSHMTREVRQKLLYQQYFFTCQCSACRSDEEQETKRLCFTAFACPKCKGAMKSSLTEEGLVGRCQNRACNTRKSLTEEAQRAQEAELLFIKGLRLLERVGVQEALDVLYESLRRRKEIFYKYHKDLAETYDAVARCHAMLGQFKKASHHCTLSSEAVEKAFGSSSVELAHELFKLAQLQFNDRQVTKALSTIDKATHLLAKHYGRSNPDVRELAEMKKYLTSANDIHPPGNKATVKAV